MLQRVAEKLMAAGVTTIVVNTHHHPEKLKAFVKQMHYPGVRFLLSDETHKLLDTGGGLRKAMPWLEGDEAIFLHNSDVLSDIDLVRMRNTHAGSGALATLAVSERSSARFFLWDETGRLCGWENTLTGETILCRDIDTHKMTRKAFSGIHLLDPALLSLIHEEGAFSINEVYLRLAATHPIRYFEHDPGFWADIGTPARLKKAASLYANNPGKFDSFV